MGGGEGQCWNLTGRDQGCWRTSYTAQDARTAGSYRAQTMGAAEDQKPSAGTLLKSRGPVGQPVPDPQQGWAWDPGLAEWGALMQPL